MLSRFGAGVEDVRRRLHSVDAEGRLHAGADCAIAIWLRTPGDVWLGRLLSLPVIHQIARIGCYRFADLLYAWNRWPLGIAGGSIGKAGSRHAMRAEAYCGGCDPSGDPSALCGLTGGVTVRSPPYSDLGANDLLFGGLGVLQSGALRNQSAPCLGYCWGGGQNTTCQIKS